MTEIPVLLLDIDGVVNAMSKQAPTHVWKADQWRRFDYPGPGVTYPLLWSQPVIDWLTGLHESGQVEIRWHTTWQSEALLFADIVGLPRFGVQKCPEWAEAVANGSALAAKLIGQCMPPWWKYPAAERVVTEERRRLIWIDDDIDYQISRGARGALGHVHELRLVCPNEGTGIIPKHMKIIGETLEYWKENPRVQDDPLV